MTFTWWRFTTPHCVSSPVHVSSSSLPISSTSLYLALATNSGSLPKTLTLASLSGLGHRPRRWTDSSPSIIPFKTSHSAPVLNTIDASHCPSHDASMPWLGVGVLGPGHWLLLWITYNANWCRVISQATRSNRAADRGRILRLSCTLVTNVRMLDMLVAVLLVSIYVHACFLLM